MSCADPGPAALQLLTQLSTGPHPAAELDPVAVALLAKWGWVFVRAGKVELTGTGRAHPGEVKGGVLDW